MGEPPEQRTITVKLRGRHSIGQWPGGAAIVEEVVTWSHFGIRATPGAGSRPGPLALWEMDADWTRILISH